VTETPYVEVIMVNFNGKADLASCLPSLFKTDYPNFDTIIVDNASTDGSLEMLQEICKHERKLKIIRSTKNIGFASANNLALKYVKGDFIVLLNCDSTVSPNWLKELVAIMANDEAVGICQSKLLSLFNQKIIDSVGDMVHPSGMSVPRGMGEEDMGKYDNEREIFSARGAAMIIRRSLIAEIGFFDPDYFMSYEDIDLSWRARLAGYEVKLAPESVVYHRGFDMYDDAYLVKIYNTYKNIYMTLIKNYEIGNLLRFMPQLVAVNLLKILSFMTMSGDLLARFVPFRFRLRLMLNLLKAPFHVVRNFPTIWMKRMHVQHMRKIPDNVIMSAMSRLPLATFLLAIRVANDRKSREYLKANKDSIPFNIVGSL
jgi:GT2 family glycosyltransferase